MTPDDSYARNSAENADGNPGADFDVVVLAGGSARRLGGADKPAVEIAGIPLLDRVLDACAGAASVVVVGPRRPTVGAVRWTREEPPGGGPVPALAAGLALGSSALVVVLAADLPFLDSSGIRVLLASLSPDTDSAVYTDARGKDQPLAAVYRRPALESVIAAITELSNSRLNSILGGLSVTRVPDIRGVAADCDTWDAVAEARRLLATSDETGEDGRHGRHH